MKLNTHQGTHLQQQLALTPSMRLALEILQKPHLELKTLIEQEMQENPLLELDEETPNTQPNDGADGASPIESSSKETDAETPYGDLDDNMTDALLANDAPSGQAAEREDTEGKTVEARSQQPSLHDHLLLQLGCLRLTPEAYAVGVVLIEHLDEHGYVVSPMDELAQTTGAPAAALERMLGILHTFDPPGVGARDLRECLLLQLQQQGQGESVAAQIVRDHLPLFLQQELKRLAAQCHRPLPEVEAACQTIRQLNPKPYRSVTADAAAVAADVTVRVVDSSYELELRDEDLPHVTISATYRRMLKNPETSDDVRGFLKNRLRQAVWFLRAVEQRHTTLLAIARAIIELQPEFLTQGPRALKPLTQAQVAADIGRHPSTVGRAIAGKYIETPYGLIALERFFASRIPQARHEPSLSDAKIKGELETLIAEEDPAHPLSDEAIAQALHRRHMAVARRTVAKYRTALQVLPAHLRRKSALASRQEGRAGRSRLAEAVSLPSRLSAAAPAEGALTSSTGNGLD